MAGSFVNINNAREGVPTAKHGDAGERLQPLMRSKGKSRDIPPSLFMPMPAAFRQSPRVEALHKYCPGSFHPVHLGDTFKQSRYTVIHKLGFGTFATVWLVKDSLNENYASLKIIVSQASEWSENSSSEELRVLQHLQAGEGEGKEYVIQLLDHFEHEGPNGVHLCIVTEVLGPSLASQFFEVFPDDKLPLEFAKRFISQATKGVRYLHSRDVVHGDFHPGNFLLYSSHFSTWRTQEDVEKDLDKPEQHSFPLSDDTLASFNSHIPKYTVYVPDYVPVL